MWEELTGDFGTSMTLCYHIGEAQVIYIPLFMKEDSKFLGIVFRKEKYTRQLALNFDSITILDADLDILKFKCLVCANDIGWNIKNLK